MCDVINLLIKADKCVKFVDDTDITAKILQNLNRKFRFLLKFIQKTELKLTKFRCKFADTFDFPVRNFKQ